MKIIETGIEGVVLMEPQVFGDERGFFFESFNSRRWKDAMGSPPGFVQENHSASVRNVVRGLHYQIRQPQGKLVRAIVGEIFDVAVDIRRASPTFGKWVGYRLSAANKRQLWVPAGMAHGFAVLSPRAEVLYLTDDYYAPEHERAIIWNDPEIGIDWPLTSEPLLSDKDRKAPPLREAELYP